MTCRQPDAEEGQKQEGEEQSIGIYDFDDGDEQPQEVRLTGSQWRGREAIGFGLPGPGSQFHGWPPSGPC